MKNFLKAIIIICFMNAIFLIMPQVKADELIYPDINGINISNFDNLLHATDYYVVDYAPSTNILSVTFFQRDYGYIGILSASSVPLYENDICKNYNSYSGDTATPCFSRIWSNLSSESRPYLSAVYESSDLGNTWVLKYNINVAYSYLMGGGTSNYIIKSTVNLYGRSSDLQNTLFYSNDFEYNPLPSFLSGYKKVTLHPGEVNFILSGLSTGSIYVPFNSFIEYGGRLSYFVKDVPYQSWDTTIDNYYVVDTNYARQDFDISSYPNASYVMFSKYLYLEGQDDIEYDIYIPNEMYFSLVTSTLNNTGGYDYTYEVIDENDDIQEESFTSLDYGITPLSPLLSDLFENFSSNTFGLTAIVTAPLNLITSITSSTCSSLNIPLPYINSTLTLPCMASIYQTYFGTFFNIYQTITFGIISYWVIVRIFNMVKDFKNPEHDEIEVLDL